MAIARPQIFLTMALGLIVGGFSAASAFAEDKPGHSHAADDTTYICPMLCAPSQKGPGRCPVCSMQLVPETSVPHIAKAEKKISTSLAALDAADRKQAVAQRFCPVMEYSRLGADGAPQKVMIDGTAVFVCCEGCIEDAEEGGKETLARVKMLTKATATLAKMPAEERAAVEAQKYCAIANKNFLGSKGAPIKLELEGKPVYLCCKGCVTKAKANPAATLAKVEALKKAGEDESHEHGDDEGHEHGDHNHEGSDHKH